MSRRKVGQPKAVADHVEKARQLALARRALGLEPDQQRAVAELLAAIGDRLRIVTAETQEAAHVDN